MRARFLMLLLIGLVATACAGAGQPSQGLSAVISVAPAASATASTFPTPEPYDGTIAGDVPDNAVFLTYHGPHPIFSVQYVEGWQVTPQADGVLIRDKDSSETVAVVAYGGDVATFVTNTDLPALRTQDGFRLDTQDSVLVGNATYVHLVFHITSPPDAVTGKRLPLTVDRYYVPGSAEIGRASCRERV